MYTKIFYVLYMHITHTRVVFTKNLHKSILQKTLDMFDIDYVYQDITRAV